MIIRDVQPADFAHILALNEESVRFLSPLTPDRLTWLDGLANYHRVVEFEGDTVAFLLALREGSAYDSPNYRWFAEHCEQFLYIDRVVVSSKCRGQGLGDRLYEDLIAYARMQSVPQVTCEFDIDPPNEVSRRFHRKFGFREVGTQSVAAGTKRVSLQAVRL
jgi:predicted GNAT superfamily acetyltransferase